MIDANKMALTHRVTALAAAYLASFGCKPIETEVPTGLGFIADLASYWYPTKTEAKKLHIPARLAEELQIPLKQIPRVWGSGPFTVLVEVKTQLADFRKDPKWQSAPPAHICIVAFPQGMIMADEVPLRWYGLETRSDGRTIRKLHSQRACLNPQHPALVLDFIAAVGIRRHHRTERAAFRDWRRAQTAEESDQRKRCSATRVLGGLASWLRHGGYQPERPLGELLPEWGIKRTPDYLLPAIEFLESLRAKAESGMQKAE